MEGGVSEKQSLRLDICWTAQQCAVETLGESLFSVRCFKLSPCQPGHLSFPLDIQPMAQGCLLGKAHYSDFACIIKQSSCNADPTQPLVKGTHDSDLLVPVSCQINTHCSSVAIDLEFIAINTICQPSQEKSSMTNLRAGSLPRLVTSI